MNLKDRPVLVFGAYGRLGVELSAYLENDYSIVRVGRTSAAEVCLKEFDKSAIIKLIDHYDVGTIINLIAQTDVVSCENNPMDAFFTNAVVPQNIQEAVNTFTRDIYVLHISSDQVYSGSGLHKESQISPCNVYGASKLSGEISMVNLPEVCILRTNYFGFSKAHKRSSYLDWLVSSIKESQMISVFQNVLFTPVGCISLCETIRKILEHRITGTYNFGSNRPISKAYFADTVARLLGEERPDLRTLVMLAKRLEKTDLFSDLLSKPNQVEDALLAALCASISEGEEAKIWTDRVTEIMTLKNV